MPKIRQWTKGQMNKKHLHCKTRKHETITTALSSKPNLSNMDDVVIFLFTSNSIHSKEN